MNPVDMHLLLISFKAIEHLCAQEMSNTQSDKKASNKSKKETRDLVMSLWPEDQRNFASRSIATSARSMGVHILCRTQKIVISMRKMDREKPFSEP
jgi:hypothetical protein